MAGGARFVALCLRQQIDAEGEHQAATDARNPLTAGGDLLDEDKGGDRRRPQEIHHAADEDEEHEEPATAEAVEAMAQPYPQRPAPAVAPMVENEVDRRPALLQTRLFDRCELVKPGGEKEHAPKN